MQDFVRFARMERTLLVWGRSAMHAVYRSELRKNRPLDFARGAAHCVVVWQARATGTSTADLAIYEGDPILVVDASQASVEQVLALCGPRRSTSVVYALHMPYWLGETVVRIDGEPDAGRLMPLVEASRVAPTPARRLELLSQLVRETAVRCCSACFGDIGAAGQRVFIACGHPLCGTCDGSVCNCRHPAHRVAPVDVPVVRIPSPPAPALAVDGEQEDAYDYQRDSDMVLLPPIDSDYDYS